MVRPARLLLPVSVKVDCAFRMTRLAGLICPWAPNVRFARLRVIVELAVIAPPMFGVVRALLSVMTWLAGSVVASMAVMVVPAGMPTPETACPTLKAAVLATVTVLAPCWPLSATFGLKKVAWEAPAGTT